MKLLTIIPARSGSKGIKNKNLTKFLGESLILYSINFAKKIKNNNIIVATDSKKIKEFSSKYLKINNYIRPKNLSKDETPLESTIYHVVNWAIKENILFDFILILQPTSPLRKIIDIKNILKTFKDDKKNHSLCSVIKMRTNPAECVVNNKQKWSFLITGKIGNRHDYKDSYYFIDGSYYLIKKNSFLKNKKIISKKNIFYPLSIDYPLDINDKLDLKVAEVIYKNYY